MVSTYGHQRHAEPIIVVMVRQAVNFVIGNELETLEIFVVPWTLYDDCDIKLFAEGFD